MENLLSTSQLKKRLPLGILFRPLTGERTVKRLRLSKALTIPDHTTVHEACRRMASRRVDAVLLTDSNALLCGILTDKVRGCSFGFFFSSLYCLRATPSDLKRLAKFTDLATL
jgi:hypothetical protein